MNNEETGFNKINLITNFVQNNFTVILILLYIFTTFFSSFGVFANHHHFFKVNFPGIHPFFYTTPMLTLSIIVFNAALLVDFKELLKIKKYLWIILIAILANFFAGILFFFLIKLPVGLLVSKDSLQQIVIAIAILTAVPIAGTATAWTQTIKGNVTLTLEMLITTTLLSPILAPVILRFFSHFLTGEYSLNLLNLAGKGADSFLTFVVVVPTIIGLLINVSLGKLFINKASSLIKLSNQVALLLLIYLNSSVVLPDLFFKNHDFPVIFTCLILAVFYCIFTYLVGWVIAMFFNSSTKDEIALIFSEGMKNVGAAFVLSNFGFPQYHDVGLLILFFALTQQLIASYVKIFLYKKLMYIKNNNGKIACFMDNRCRITE